jgi:hypothetical protein
MVGPANKFIYLLAGPTTGKGVMGDVDCGFGSIGSCLSAGQG